MEKRLILQKKTTITKEELCKKCPKELEEFVEYVRSLEYTDEPNYENCRNLFLYILESQGHQYDYIYDWTTQKDLMAREPTIGTEATSGQKFIGKLKPTKLILQDDDKVQPKKNKDNNENNQNNENKENIQINTQVKIIQPVITERICIAEDKPEIIERPQTVRAKPNLTGDIYKEKPKKVIKKEQISYSKISEDELNEIKLLKENLENQMKLFLQRKTSDLSARKERLQALNPNKVLKRGFAMIKAKNGKIVKQVSDIKVNEEIETTLSDGKVYANVTRKEKHV